MTARRGAQPPPIEVRRHLWARVWREALLRPRPEGEATPAQPAPTADDECDAA